MISHFELLYTNFIQTNRYCQAQKHKNNKLGMSSIRIKLTLKNHLTILITRKEERMYQKLISLDKDYILYFKLTLHSCDQDKTCMYCGAPGCEINLPTIFARGKNNEKLETNTEWKVIQHFMSDTCYDGKLICKNCLETYLTEKVIIKFGAA